MTDYHDHFDVAPNLYSSSSQLAGVFVSPGSKISAISLDGTNYTPVTTTDPTYNNSVTLTGRYISFAVNQDGTYQERAAPDDQTVIDAINANQAAAAPLSDTLYYKVVDPQGTVTLDTQTFALDDVIFTRNGDPANGGSSAFADGGHATVAATRTVAIPGFSVDKALSSAQIAANQTDAASPLSVTVGTFNLQTGAVDGTLSVDPTVSGGGGTVTATSSGLTISGTVAQIDADLSTLSYTAGSTVGRSEITVSAEDGPATTSTFFKGEVDTVPQPTLTALASFDGPHGAGPQSALIADAAGNLFGTTLNGGANGAPDGDGTVFELTKTATGYSDTPTVLASFDGADGQAPVAGLVADATGNLFGVTSSGGAGGNGAIFEIAKTASGYSSTPQTLASFDGTNGSFALGGLITDGNGDLFGTTADGSSFGTVFELKNTDGVYDTAPTVLATFDSASGYAPAGSLVADATGNLFGVALNGGATGNGTIFEIVKDGASATGYDSAPVALASFSGTDGASPEAGLIIDADGNLFGTTTDGGSGLTDGGTTGGTVFELRNTGGAYDSAPTVLANLDATTGTLPIGGLIMDAVGDLFGAAANGGANNAGTIFELAKASSGYDAPTVVVSLDTTNGSGPFASLFADQAGNLFGTAFAGGASGDGTVFEVTDSGFVPASAACYCRGTLIATDHGLVAIEALAVGDLIVTASGAHRPVKWLGHRTIDLTRHPDPKAVWPVCVSAGAFGADLPTRDLWLSPGHNIAVRGVLMPISAVQNGVSVVQVPVDAVTYWHVELDSHDIILAEGLPAESYLDTGNRTAFANGGSFIEAHPDFEPKHWAETCLPLVKTGREVEAAKAVLLDRLKALGHETTAAHDLHIVADGERIEPITLGDRRFAFAVPRGCRQIALASRSFVPSHVMAGSTDDRVLGVCVKRLHLDGEDVDLRDPMADDWHGPEQQPAHLQRWTTGRTALPPGTRIVVVDLAEDGVYRVERRDNVVALFA